MRVHDGEALSETQFITVTIQGADDAPVAGDDTDFAAEGGGRINSTVSVLANDSDPDDVETVTGVVATSNGDAAGTIGSALQGKYGTLTLRADGTYTYIVNNDELGVGERQNDVFTYTVTGGDLTDTATLTITVTGINDRPEAADDTARVNEGARVSGNVITGDPTTNAGQDTDPDNGTTLTVTHLWAGTAGKPGSGSDVTVGTAKVIEGAYGRLTLNADGSYSYAANRKAKAAVTDTFTYEVSDGSGQANGTDTATLTITVNGTDEGPEDGDAAPSVGDSSRPTVRPRTRRHSRSAIS